MSRSDSPLLDRMVFLVGAQRSGTNWLQRMLATHRAVVTLPSETHLFTGGMDVLAERFQHGVVGSPATGSVYMDRDEFLDAARDFCDRVFGGVAGRLDTGAARVLERSPNHVERLDLIGAIYPDAWFLHIVRDGRDVARSLLSQPWGPTTIDEAAETWARSVSAARAAAPALGRYREVRYEALLDDPAKGMRAVFEWLDVSASVDDVDRVVAEAGVSFNADAKRPEIGTSKWLADWSAEDLASFDRVAGGLLRELGYPEAPALADAPPKTRTRLGRRPTLRRSRPVAPPAPRLPMEAQQRTVDAFCAALAAGDTAAAADLLAPEAAVRVVDNVRDERVRANGNRELVADALAADPAPWGRQLRGDVHVGGTNTTVVLTHELDGSTVDRVFVLGFDRAARVTSLTAYRFPRDQSS